nr:zinc finger and BTB domain-containing protein 6-like isoform X1 [Cherax quadricarinatus]XP_053632255.1 zinc finger and BTB domain-containing protein 6-like isoform X1 [Cherax quadricarinatus]XP_053632258.1 zinc finger and BTB domain-containing protein 6-like isoform X1 [Cherax quadricarinatus]
MGERMLVLSWKNHSSTFTSAISTLREKENYSDVTVACEGKFYPAHKLVLAACSEYFEEIFQHTSCRHPVIILQDISHTDVEALLNYMYAGVASVSQNDLTSLIKAAEALRVKGLAVPDGPPSHGSETRATDTTSSMKTSPKPKKRKKAENISTVSENASETFQDIRNQEDFSQHDAHYDHVSHSSEKEEVGGAEEEEVNDGMNTSSDTADNSSTSQGQMALKSEAQCTADMPHKDIFNEVHVKEEILDITDDRQHLSYSSEIDYHAMSDGTRQAGESEGGQDDQMTQGSFLKYDSLEVNQRNLSQNTPGFVGSLPSQPGDQHNPGPSRMSQNASNDYEEFLGLEGYSCDTQQELYNQLTNHLNLQNHQPHLPMIQNNSNELFHRRNRSPKSLTQMYSEKKMHRCVHCNYSTPWHSVFIRHCRRHSGEKPFSCSFCPFRSSRKSVVNRHCLSKHSSVAAS